MKTNNSLGKTEFVWEHAFWAVIAWILYKDILFRCLDSYSYTESKLILLAIVVVSCVAGICLWMKECRNEVSVFFNLIFGYGIYTIPTYVQIRRSFIIICLSIAGILSIAYAIFVMCRKISDRKHAGWILRWRAIHVASMTHRLIGVGLVLIIAVCGANILFGSTIMKSRVSAATQANVSEQSLSNNMETIARLREDAWGSLTVQERLDVLQTVANIEQRYLGLPNELNIGAANLDDGILGYYADQTHEIVLDMDSLLHGTSEEMLDTVCHEAYHSYQYRMADAFNEADESSKNLKMFRKANSYAREFENYVNGEKDFCGYYDQDCESDARDYAEDAVEDYCRRINEYLLENEK